MKHQLTGTAGLYHVAHELSRRGWNVLLTTRNSKGADLYAASGDESVVLSIQSKALKGKIPVPLGEKLENLRSPWWVITINANSAAPSCYVMTLEEVKAAAHCGVSKDGKGKISCWMQAKGYAKPEYLEAWDRLGSPAEAVELPAA